MYFSDVSKLGHLGAEAHTKALALTRGVDWGSLDQAGRAEMVSEDMSKLGHLGAEAHAKALALTRGVEWGVDGSGGASRDGVRGNLPRCRLCTYVYMYRCVCMRAYAYGCVCASMI
jgi:hypothetical protein